MARTERSRRGFTMIEMNAVVAVLLLATAIVVPNLVAFRRSREHDDMMAALARVATTAVNEARSSGSPVRVTVSEDALVMERVPVGGETSEVSRLSYASWLSLDSQQSGGKDADAADWAWWAYPDGAASSAALTFKDGSAQRSLLFSKEGRANWVRGAVADQPNEEWTAGEIEVSG